MAETTSRCAAGTCPDLRRLDVYLQRRRLRRRAQGADRRTSPKQLVEMVKASNLRGRGGAGFPTGMKWSFLPKTDREAASTCASTPTRASPARSRTAQIIEDDPHLLIEGVLIAAYAIQCHTAYIYIRGEFALGAERARGGAAPRPTPRGILGKNILGTGFDLDVVRPPRRRRLHLRRGDRADRVARGQARLPAHQAAVSRPRTALFGCPTIVNNVETLACVPHIVARGAEWFRGIGPEKSPGPEALLRLAATSCGPASTSCRWARRCARSSTSTPAASRTARS